MNKVAPPLPVGGAEGKGGGAVSVLSSPPPPSLLAALDDLLERQETHDKAVRTLQTCFWLSVSILAVSSAVAVLL